MLTMNAAALDPFRTASDAPDEAAAVVTNGKPSNMAVPAPATRAGELRAANRTLMVIYLLYDVLLSVDANAKEGSDACVLVNCCHYLHVSLPFASDEGSG